MYSNIIPATMRLHEFIIKKIIRLKSIFSLLLIVNNQLCIAQQLPYQLSAVQDSAIIVEKVYLHTDRDYYSQGDDIWFKAYLVEDPDLFLSYNSMNLHVELISSQSEIIDSRIIRIEGGLGKGDIRLSDTLPPGVYIIRAYTNYMRNFADMQIFEKTLMIFSSSDKGTVRSDSVIKPSVTYDVNFFTEGGSLVNNVTCCISFRAADETGKGCDVSGEVYTSSGERVALLRTAYKGMGRFYMRPLDGLSYYAMIETPDGKIIRKNLPQSSKNGFTLNVSDYQENGPLITIRTNPATLESLIDQVHFITVSAHKRVVSTLGFSINSLSTNFRLPLDDLPDGIIQLTLINSDELPLCERLIFHSKENLKLKVSTDKPIYKRREKVSVKLSLISDSVNNDNTFLSMSAVETSFLNSNRLSNPTISSWFLLESDIRGPVEDPAYYFDPGNPDRINNLDLLLCTQGWRDFKWKYGNQVFRPEFGIAISGRVTKLITENPLQSAVVTAILRKEKNELMLTSATDSAGLFSFDEVDFTGDARLIATAVSEKDNPAGHLIIDTTGYSPEPEVNKKSGSGLMLISDLIPEEEQSETEHEFIVRKNKDVKLMLSDTIQLGEVKIVARRNKAAPVNYQTQTAYALQRAAVGIPDQTVKITPQDERFTNFRDIIRKGVSGVRVEITNNVSESGIRIRGSRFEPLFMLDGITVPYDMVATLPIKWIDRIEILKSGGIASSFDQKSSEMDPKFNGVISIITKPEEKRDEKMTVFHSVNRIVKGYDAPRIFYSPDYSSASTPDLPDVRSTLFWNPDVTVIDNETIDYYNADNKGNVMIIIEGITSDGIPVTGKSEYKVE
ncbi:MAG TPA: hypothetical protein DCP74_09775 [Bacteroidales bacterium]|nr:hypothetical protein [Bacteroidales bacterium]